MDLDQLQRGLRAEASRLEPTDLAAARRGVDGHLRRRRILRGAAVAAVVVLAAGFGLALVGHHGQSAERVVTNSGPAPHLAPAFMSDEVRFSNVVELPNSGLGPTLPAQNRLWIYATGTPGDPLGGTSFAVLVVELAKATPSSSGTGASKGFVGYTPDVSGQRGADFRVDATTSFVVLSSQLSDQQLRSLGESVRVTSSGPVPGLGHVDLPPGYHQVVTDASGSVLGPEGDAIDASAHGYVMVWNSATPDEEGLRLLFLTVTDSQPADLEALRWSLQAVTRVDVNGRSAVLGSLPGGETVSGTSTGHGGTATPGPRTWTLSWFLADGTTRVTIAALGGLTQPGCSGDCTPRVLEQIARSLHPVGAAQWQTYASATTTTEPGCSTEQPNGGEVCSSSGSGGVSVGVTTTVTGGR